MGAVFSNTIQHFTREVMTDQELFAYTQERGKALNEVTRNNKYQPRDAEDAADTLLREALRHFSQDVYNKAMLARDKYGFHPLGWATPDWQEELQKGIAEHLLKGDPRDVAVYAMFAWFHGWRTAPAPSSLVRDGDVAANLARLIEEAEDRGGQQAIDLVANVMSSYRKQGRDAGLDEVTEGYMIGKLAELIVEAVEKHNAMQPRAASPFLGEGAAPAGWVSVADRLPEAEYWSESVLTLWNTGVMTVQPWYNGSNDHLAYLHHAGRFLNETPYQEDGQAYVTHWQPLPAAPATAPSEKAAQPTTVAEKEACDKCNELDWSSKWDGGCNICYQQEQHRFGL